MKGQSVIAVLTFLHIVTAMGWLGGVIFFLSTVGPGARTFTPPALLEFLTDLGPKQVRFFAGVATGTIVFGLVLLFAAFGTDYSSWPNYIEAGLGFGLIAYLVAILVTIPTIRRVARIARQAMNGPPGPPSRAHKAAQEGQHGNVYGRPLAFAGTGLHGQ